MKKIVWAFIAALLISFLGACGTTSRNPEGLIKKVEEDADKGNEISSLMKDDVEEKDQKAPLFQQNVSLYFLNKESNKLTCEARNIITSDAGLLFEEMITALIRGPESNNLQPVIARGTKVLGVEETDNIVLVNLSEKFLESENLIVARTALVNTLTELEGIKYVKINVNGQELTKDGTDKSDIVGVLSRSTNNIDEIVAAENRKESEDSIFEFSKELFFRDFRGHYLLSEIRQLKVTEGEIVRSIIEELIKGPVEMNKGLYPVMPKGTKLLDIELLEGSDESKVVALYFSKQLKSPFTEEGTSRGEKNQDPKVIEEKTAQIENKEAVILSSIVYSLNGLPDIEGVKIFYEDKYGNFIDRPLHKIELKRPLKVNKFPNKLGRKIKIYFANDDVTQLVPDYRAMNRDDLQIANAIIEEIILGPREETEQIRVIPPEVERGDIKVWMDDTNSKVMVDLPSGKIDGNKMGSSGSLMALYAIVNSLTDPMNTSNIKEVQFLVDGNVVDTFGNLEFSEPFIRNPAIIQE